VRRSQGCRKPSGYGTSSRSTSTRASTASGPR
jgi:hypothetical protein